jgi:hypothetical protein
MILAPISDSELAPSEGHSFELGLGMIDDGLIVLGFVVVRGDAVVVGGSHVDPAGMLARPGTISSHSPGPARARARAGAVRVLQRLVF